MNKQDEPINITIVRQISDKLKESDQLAAVIRMIDKGTGIDQVVLLNSKDKITIPKNYESIASQSVSGALQIAKDMLGKEIEVLIEKLKTT